MALAAAHIDLVADFPFVSENQLHGSGLSHDAAFRERGQVRAQRYKSSSTHAADFFVIGGGQVRGLLIGQAHPIGHHLEQHG